VLEKHNVFVIALREYEAAEALRRQRHSSTTAAVKQELGSVVQQIDNATSKLAELGQKLQPFKIGIIGRLIGEVGIRHGEALYRESAAQLVQARQSVYENYVGLRERKYALEAKLRSLQFEFSLRKPASVAKVRDQLKTFPFDLSEINADRVRELIVEKTEHAARERQRLRERDKEKQEPVKARAAAYDNKQRQQAKSVRNSLRKQLDELPYCPYCTSPLSLDAAHADHIYPLAKGGLSTKRNMVFICASCNSAKGHLTLRAFLKKTKFDEEMVHENLEQLGKDF